MIIKCLGVWIPQAMSFQSAERRSWLPADNDSIRVNLNEGIYDIPLNKLRESIPDLEKAINEKISKINVSGKTIFATPENLVIIIIRLVIIHLGVIMTLHFRDSVCVNILLISLELFVFT